MRPRLPSTKRRAKNDSGAAESQHLPLNFAKRYKGFDDRGSAHDRSSW